MRRGGGLGRRGRAYVRRSAVHRPSSTLARVSFAFAAGSLLACTKASPNERATPSAERLEPATPAVVPASASAVGPASASAVGPAVAPATSPAVAPVVAPASSPGVAPASSPAASPAPLPGPAEPRPGHVVVGDVDAGADESAEVDWQESPLEADLDGDGVPEAIQWSCGQGPQTLRIAVGRAKTRVKYRVSELIGCIAAVVTLRPDEATRQLIFTIDEHEEVGPDLHFIYAYRKAKLALVWSGTANVDFLVDGTWVAETSDCDDVAGYLTTTTSRHRWNGAKVTSVVKKDRTPVEPGGCADP
jgi:hypothetical protein